MKKQTYLLGLILASGPLATATFGATYFLPGVSVESGWHDAEKEWKGVDDNMCWAAQAACMAQYWQDWYVKAGNKLPTGTPTGYTTLEDGSLSSNIFETFKANWTNLAGTGDLGLPWYFTGAAPTWYYQHGYSSNSAWSKLQSTTTHTGAFSELYQGGVSEFEKTEGLVEHLQYDGGLSIQEFTDAMMHHITEEYSIVGLSLDFWLKTGGHAGGHAVTLWGFETDDTTNLANAIYITDSDDGYYGIKRYEIDTYYDGFDTELGTYLDESLRDKYSTSFDKFITLSVDRFVTAIPEPSAFGLLAGIFALAVSTARRRRK